MFPLKCVKDIDIRNRLFESGLVISHTFDQAIGSIEFTPNPWWALHLLAEWMRYQNLTGDGLLRPALKPIKYASPSLPVLSIAILHCPCGIIINTQIHNNDLHLLQSSNFYYNNNPCTTYHCCSLSDISGTLSSLNGSTQIPSLPFSIQHNPCVRSYQFKGQGKVTITGAMMKLALHVLCHQILDVSVLSGSPPFKIVPSTAKTLPTQALLEPVTTTEQAVSDTLFNVINEGICLSLWTHVYVEFFL